MPRKYQKICKYWIGDPVDVTLKDYQVVGDFLLLSIYQAHPNEIFLESKKSERYIGEANV